jgi:hypothetical protein
MIPDRRILYDSLRLPAGRLDELNAAIFSPDSRALNDFLEVVERYGSPEAINRKSEASRQLPALLERVKATHPAYLEDLEWLRSQRDAGAFVRLSEYRRRLLGAQAEALPFDPARAVTLEISACQYFPWLMDIARRAVANGEIMPGRFVRVRNMKEQEADGDLPAFAAAMQIIGASWVEQLDTRGSDGSNLHLGGPDTLIGYYGGVGQPNRHALRWLDEYLYYYTHYGVRQVLNVNTGTVLLGFLLHRLGVDIEFKISVTLGHDNPYAALWTLATARLFARDDGTSPLVGLNWSNSTDTETIDITAQVRRSLGLEDMVRFEHHVTETWKGLVIQPYLRREDVLELAGQVANLSAKHEGGEPEVEQARERSSDIRDYYRTKDEILASGEWESLTLNFGDKFESLNRTARALTERGLAFIAAGHLHRP